MKFGIRKPSLKKSIAARTSTKRFIRHSLGLKAPRGYGWLTNPKKAAYNRAYNRSTISASKGIEGLIIGLVITALFFITIGLLKIIWNIILGVYQLFRKKENSNIEFSKVTNSQDLRVKLIYCDVRKNRTERIVQVHEFDLNDDMATITGYCEKQNAKRTFRLDRIIECIDLKSNEKVTNLEKFFGSKFAA